MQNILKKYEAETKEEFYESILTSLQIGAKQMAKYMYEELQTEEMKKDFETWFNTFMYYDKGELSTEECYNTFLNALNNNTEDQQQDKDETTEAPQPKNKTYFMFYGADVKFLLNEEIELTEENTSDFELFTFIEGETRPHDLLNSVLGWGEYSEITEEEFFKYSNL